MDAYIVLLNDFDKVSFVQNEERGTANPPLWYRTHNVNCGRCGTAVDAAERPAVQIQAEPLKYNTANVAQDGAATNHDQLYQKPPSSQVSTGRSPVLYLLLSLHLLS